MFAEINKESGQHLPFLLNTVGTSRKQGAIVRPKGNPYHQLIWVSRGQGEFCMGEERRLLQVGEGCFIRADVVHSYHGEDFSTVWVTFLGAEGLLDLAEAGDYFFFSLPPSLSEATEDLLRRIEQGTSMITRSALGYSLVAEFLDRRVSEQASPMRQVRSYMENHYAEDLSLADLATVAGTDKYTLCHRYQKEYGCSVITDLRRIRVEKAKRFLRYSAEPVEAIGQMCGFESPSYFAKRFHEVCGRTPREYRKQHNR